MFLGAVLDVAIGLIFTYLLIALFAAAVQEWVANRLKLRSELLYDGLWRLLTIDNHNRPRVSPRQVAAPLTEGLPTTAAGFFDAVWGHQLIKGLSQDSHGPSYIPARAFCTALVDVLRNGSGAASMTAIGASIERLPSGAAKQAISAIFTEAGEDLNRFKSGIASWFDDSMERASGAYKRWAQRFTFLFGLAAAVVLNVSTIEVATTLWRDPEARKAVAASAVEWANANPTFPADAADHRETEAGQVACEVAETGAKCTAAKGQALSDPPTSPGAAPPPEPQTEAEKAAAKPAEAEKAAERAEARARELADQLLALPIPIGWNTDWQTALFGLDEPRRCVENVPCEFSPSAAIHLFTLLFGWLLTALAVAMGAPFWFDTLQKFINIRSAGKPPAKAGAQ